MTDLDALLTDQFIRFEAHQGTDDPPLSMSFMCTLDVGIVEPDPGVAGVMVVAHADIAPGGRIGEAWLEARDDDASRTAGITSGSGLHRALLEWFHDMWSSWDEVPEGTEGDVLEIRASNLRPGDLVWRLDRIVAGVHESGINAADEPVVTVDFEDTTGTEVWPADQLLTVIRDTDEADEHDG
ncbi:MAG: hypothetical protein L0G85_00220 [Kocuria sp.]|nr:hypothetical protein [Kocuria sp.]